MILTVSLLLHIMILYGKRNGGLRLTNLQLERLWLCFLTYSCLGWIIEVLFVLFTGGGLTNRGFLLGPYCPIYGVGCLTILVLTGNLARKPLRFIFSAMIICGILEYSTSVFMEYLFHERWWDYSGFFFQIDGRVCLETLVPFGALSYAVTCHIHPLVEKRISGIRRSSLHRFFRWSLFLFAADLLTTLWHHLR